MPTSENTSFNYTAVHLLPSEQIGLHVQSTWELSYVIVGSGTRVIGNRTEPFQGGEVILIPPDIPHCWHFDADVTDEEGKIANITLTFDNSFLERCVLAFPELMELIENLRTLQEAVKLEGKEADEVISLLEEMRNRTHSQRVPCMLRLLLLLTESRKECVVGYYRKVDRDKKRLNDIRSYVICNFDRDILLDDVARHVGMNRAAFCVFFKRATGKTFVTYLNEYRVEMACQLLQQRRMAVSEVCYHAGFNNVPYFNRLFKRVKGMTPGEFLLQSKE